MNKQEAEREALRRWRRLPIMQRQTFDQAIAFSESSEAEIEFHTMGNTRHLVQAWLVKDIERTAEIAARF